MSVPEAVFDTNVFVAAGFRRSSASAQLLALVRAGKIRLVWDEPTRRETRNVLRRIPRLSWEEVEDLFTEGGAHRGGTEPGGFGRVTDATDRKFAALAAAAGVPLVSSDHDLLEHRGDPGFEVRTPGEMVARVDPEVG